MRKTIFPENQARTERFTVFLACRYSLPGCSLDAHPRQSKRSFGACGAQGLSPLCRGLHFIQKEWGTRDVTRRHGAHREPAGASYSSWACSSSHCQRQTCAPNTAFILVVTAVVTEVWAVSICIGCHNNLFQRIFLQASCFLNSPLAPMETVLRLTFQYF